MGFLLFWGFLFDVFLLYGVLCGTICILRGLRICLGFCSIYWIFCAFVGVLGEHIRRFGILGYLVGIVDIYHNFCFRGVNLLFVGFCGLGW